MCTALLPFLSLPSHSLRDFSQGPVNMYNCLVVTVSASTFANNHAQSVFTDLPSRISGGGLSITINDTRNSSLTRGRFNYTIQYCVFANNSANSSAPSAGPVSILQGGHINNRGGGVAFYVVHSSVVEFGVSLCYFSKNSALYGGGLYVFSPELFTEEDFTIADNVFVSNAADSGGGIALAAALQHTTRSESLKKDVLKVSILFSTNYFEWNRANLGGALFIAPGELGCQ